MNGGNKKFCLQEFLLQTARLKAFRVQTDIINRHLINRHHVYYVLRFNNLQIFTAVKSVNLRRNLQLQSHNFPHLRCKISKIGKNKKKRERIVQFASQLNVPPVHYSEV
jgi:hypothetical protein